MVENMSTGYDSSMEMRLLSNAMERKSNLEIVMDSVTDDDFFESDNKAVFRMLKEMYMDGYEVNLYTVLEKYGNALKGMSFGDRSFLQAFNSLTLPGETRILVENVKELANLRKLNGIIAKASALINSGEGSAKASRVLEDGLIGFSSTAKRDLVAPKDMGMTILESVIERMDAEKRRESVINTHFRKLNKATQGFEKGDLVILSAESGAGKSAFAMNLSKDIAIDQKRPLLYLNSEMATKQMALRWCSFMSKVSHSKLREGATTDEDFKRISSTADIFALGKLYTLNIPDLQVENVLSEIRRAKSRYGIEMAIVDYIGRMDTINNKDAKEWQVLLNGARRLKTIAQEMGIVVVMVAQLAEGGNRLAQGSYMKFETDLWLNICRFKEREDLAKYAPWNCYLEFRKSRNSAVGNCLQMNFYGDTLTFTDVQEEAEKYWELEYPDIPVFLGKEVKAVPV